MTPPEPGDVGNPFQSLLGDLMNMLGTNGPDQWEMTRSFALNVATGGEAEPNVEPVQRIRLEQLARVAELNVSEVTGLAVAPDGRRLSCVAVGRGDWTLRALDSWRAVLSSMAPADELLLVTANIASFADDWSLPEEEALLWVCARELATNAVLTRPDVRARIEELLHAYAVSPASAQQDLAGKLRGLTGGDDPGAMGAGMDLESLQGMFGDPEALMGELLTPESRRTSDRLTAVAVVVDAYADHIATRVGAKLVGAHTQLAEAWYRRRTERGKGEEAAGALFGLDLDQAQVDRGRAFVAGVVERAGEDGLARLWNPARNLPTPAEVDAPGLWLERIDLPELDAPDD